MKPKPKKRGKPSVQEVRYDLEIVDWTWDYGFGINELPALGTNAFISSRSLEVFCKILQPERYRGISGTLTFSPRSIDANLQRTDLRQDFISTTTINKKGFYAYLPLPEQDLQPLLVVLSAGKIRYLSIDGQRRAGRHDVEIRSYQFWSKKQDCEIE